MNIKKAVVVLMMVSGLAGIAAPAMAEDKSASADECLKAISIINDLINSGCNDPALFELRADALVQLKRNQVSQNQR